MKSRSGDKTKFKIKWEGGGARHRGPHWP